MLITSYRTDSGLVEKSSCQFGLDLRHDASKRRHVMNGDIGQNLTVNFDTRLLQAVGELAIGHATLTRSGIDTGNPQLAEDTFLGTAVTVGILPSLHYRFFSDTEDITAATAKTFGKGENFFVAGASRYTTFDARHVLLLVRR
jgi:hypothetical protein